MNVQRAFCIAIALLTVGCSAYWGAKGLEPVSVWFGFTAAIACIGACLPEDWL